MYTIDTLDDPARLNLHVDGQFRVELIRRDEGLSINVYAAKTDAPITETWATIEEALSADHDDESDDTSSDNPSHLT